MRIESFTIDSFANPEYTRAGSHSLDSVNGRDILVRGQNQSGKTHTFNALLYCLLGETIALQIGHGNSVQMELSNGFRIHRAEAGHTLNDGDNEFGPEDVDRLIAERVGSRNLIHSHFLHSRISELPLENFNRKTRIDRVLAASTDGLGERIDDLNSEIEGLSDDLERLQAERNSVKKELNRRNRQLSNIRSQVEKWGTIVQLGDSGRLAEISEILQREPQLEQRIDELGSRKFQLITEIREYQNELTRAEELEQDIRDILMNALEEFICPVCSERVNRGRVKNRLDDEHCPFCKQPTDIEETVEHLQVEKAQSDGEAEELKEKILELQEEKEEVSSQIESLKEERPEIADLNSYAVNLLKEYEHDVPKILDTAEEKLRDARNEEEKYTEMIEGLESEVEDTEDAIESVEQTIDHKKGVVDELERGDVASRIEDFEELWNTRYREVAPEIARDFNLRGDGRILLPSDEERDREYDTRGDLADSEIVLLNLSFAIALNETANEYDSVDWSTIILDEPFSRLDSEITSDALKFLKDIDQQVVLTTSDDEVSAEFGHAALLSLHRQATLGDYADD